MAHSNVLAGLVVQQRATAQVDRREVLALCEAAYAEPLHDYLAQLDGQHLLVRDGALVAHAMWVPRTLRIGEGPGLEVAYVELVATAPARQGEGIATALMNELVQRVGVAALSSAGTSLYERLGWARWPGPLSARRGDARVETPDEDVFVWGIEPSTQPLSIEWRPGEIW